MADVRPEEISAILKQQLAGFGADTNLEEVGTVLQVGDGIARIYGLNRAQSGELVELENGVRAIVLNLEEDNVGAVLMGASDGIREGSIVKRTGKIASIEVGEGFVGRVVNTLGQPIDGKGPISGAKYEMPLERKAPGVIYRQPVNEPLQTGVKAIDSMIPIGRGQRELIIGDRQVGKTAIAIDTIINQKEFFDRGEPVYCIYVACGQKASTVASVARTLEEYGAMSYTTIVSSSASDPAPLQFYAPSQVLLSESISVTPVARRSLFMMTSPSRLLPTARHLCCSAVLRAAKLTRVTYSICTAASSSALRKSSTTMKSPVP
jgi:F-type H+-transporting ATPase subunit alpha